MYIDDRGVEAASLEELADKVAKRHVLNDEIGDVDYEYITYGDDEIELSQEELIKVRNRTDYYVNIWRGIYAESAAYYEQCNNLNGFNRY